MASYLSNNFKELVATKIIDFDNDTFKIILMQAGFAFSRAAHDVYADISAYELATASGYTAGGATLAGVSTTRNDTIHEFQITWTNPTWTASGGDLTTSGAIIFDDTVAAPAADPIVGYIDFGGSLITYDGGTFTIANVTVIIR